MAHLAFNLAAGLATTIFPLSPSLAEVDSVHVRVHEGVAHGFIVLKDAAGKSIASGEEIQTVHGKHLESRLTLHFRDGSIDDESAVAIQDPDFHLVREHHIQKGPSFPTAADVSLDIAAQQVDYVVDGSKEKKSEHMDLPLGLSNGILFTLIRNLQIPSTGVAVPYLATSSKPRLVQLLISPDGVDHYTIDGFTHKADRYLIKVKLGAVTGAMASVMGKRPADYHLWVSSGVARAILRVDGAFFDGGPIWSLQLASPQWRR